MRCDECGSKECCGGPIGVERDEARKLLATERDAFGKRETELLKLNAHISDENIKLRNAMKTWEQGAIEDKREIDRLSEALDRIANGKFHIGNDWNGNVFGPPDAVMCRNIAKETLRATCGDEGDGK